MAAGNIVATDVSGGRQYFTCGDPDWDHLQVHARVDLRNAQAVGIAVGVGSGIPVSQAIICTIEGAGGGHALVVRSRSGGAETELGRATIAVSGPVLLTVTAFDDVVRATVGDASVNGTRNAVREGRVALVASGPAAFAGIAVGALDIYAFEFVTSKFASFAEHLGTYDGTAGALQAGAFGGTPASIATVYAANAAAISSVMQASADPQARQKLFDAVLTQLCDWPQETPAGCHDRSAHGRERHVWILAGITRSYFDHSGRDDRGNTRHARVGERALRAATRASRASILRVAAMALGGLAGVDADHDAMLATLAFSAEGVAASGCHSSAQVTRSSAWSTAAPAAFACRSSMRRPSGRRASWSTP